MMEEARRAEASASVPFRAFSSLSTTLCVFSAIQRDSSPQPGVLHELARGRGAKERAYGARGEPRFSEWT